MGVAVTVKVPRSSRRTGTLPVGRRPYGVADPAVEEGNGNLRKLAEQTGGRMLFPRSPKQIGEAFEKISEELRSRYAISYWPADFSTNGRYRKITIEARKAGKRLQVRARKATTRVPHRPGIPILRQCSKCAFCTGPNQLSRR